MPFGRAKQRSISACEWTSPTATSQCTGAESEEALTLLPIQRSRPTRSIPVRLRRSGFDTAFGSSERTYTVRHTRKQLGHPLRYIHMWYPPERPRSGIPEQHRGTFGRSRRSHHNQVSPTGAAAAFRSAGDTVTSTWHSRWQPRQSFQSQPKDPLRIIGFVES